MKPSATLRNGVHPYFIGSNRIDRDSAVVSRVDGLCNLDDGLDIRSGQTRSILANNFGLRAASKNKCAENEELAHEI
jgi:hypothetical protein